MEQQYHVPHSLEWTFIDEKWIITHYTCNAPKEEKLLKFWIFPIGYIFWCKNNTEVIRVTKWVVEKLIWHNIPDNSEEVLLTLYCEKAMRVLSERNNKHKKRK